MSNAISRQDLVNENVSLSDEEFDKFCGFFILLECPKSFRALNEVLSNLLEISQKYPAFFEAVFLISKKDLEHLIQVISNSYIAEKSDFLNHHFQRGWCRTHVVYALLARYKMFASTSNRAVFTLIFLKHFFENVDVIFNLEREEEVTSAFRNLNQNKTFNLSNYDGVTVEEIVEHFERLRKIDTLDDSVERHLRQLCNFFNLSWKTRTQRKSSKREFIRQKFNNKQLERIIGADDNMYTCIAKNRVDHTQSGIEHTEALPSIGFIKTESDIDTKPKHEIAAVKQINEHTTHRKQTINISNSVQCAHNSNCLSKEILQAHELNFLLLQLQKRSNYRKLIGVVEMSVVCKLISASLYLSKSIEDVCTLKVLKTHIEDGEGFVSINNTWHFKAIFIDHLTVAEFSKSRNLVTINDYSLTQIPAFVVKQLDLHEANVGLLFKKMSKQRYRDSCTTFLKNLSDTHNVTVSLKRIQHFSHNYNEANQLIDPVIFDFAFNHTTYKTRASRHYTQYSFSIMSANIFHFWQMTLNRLSSNGFDHKITIGSYVDIDYQSICDSDVVGSRFLPSNTFFQERYVSLQKRLSDYNQWEVQSSFHKLTQYHNDYVFYVSCVLLSMTGYRAVYNPLPSLNLRLSRYQMLMISDKDDLDFTHARFIPLADTLNKQLNYYQRHLEQLTNILHLLQPEQALHTKKQNEELFLSLSTKQSEATSWFSEIKNSRIEPGVLFYFAHNRNGTHIKNVHPGWLTQNENTGYPLNATRHYLRTYLTRNELSPELIAFTMGHWSTGEAPLGRYSTFDFNEACSVISPIIQQMASELEIAPVRSLLT